MDHFLCVLCLSSSRLSSAREKETHYLTHYLKEVESGWTIYIAAIVSITCCSQASISSSLSSLTVLHAIREMLEGGRLGCMADLRDQDGLVLTVYEREMKHH